MPPVNSQHSEALPYNPEPPSPCRTDTIAGPSRSQRDWDCGYYAEIQEEHSVPALSASLANHHQGPDRFQSLSYEALSDIIHQNKDPDGRPLTNSDLEVIIPRLKYWKEAISLTGRKRARDDVSDDEELPRQLDMVYGEVEILTLRSTLSFWIEWKADLARVWQLAPWTYRKGHKKISKACSFMDKDCRTLWNTYKRRHPAELDDYDHFLQWTKTLIKAGPASENNIYEDWRKARQQAGQSPAEFDAILSVLEGQLKEEWERFRAQSFFGKLQANLKNMIKKEGHGIPQDHHEIVVLAQQVWEGMGEEEKTGSRKNPPAPRSHHVPDRPNQRRTSPIISHPSNGKRKHGPGDFAPDGRVGKKRTSKRQRDIPDRGNRKDLKTSLGVNKKSKYVCFKCGVPGHHIKNCAIQMLEQVKQESPEIQASRIFARLSDSSSS
jgi:hypothetical protein